jgi:hypothetical protein
MAAGAADLAPAVALDESDDLAYLHGKRRYAAIAMEWSRAPAC